MLSKAEKLKRSQTKQTGLGLISAVFVITILAILITAMAQFFSLGQQVIAQEFMQARALVAAQAGIQLESACLSAGAGNCSANATVGHTTSQRDYWPGPSSNSSFSESGLRNCHAEVFYYRVDSSLGTFYTVNSTGICGKSGLDRASRQIIMRVNR